MIKQEQNDTFIEIPTSKKLRFINLFWIGFIIYVVSFTLFTTTIVNAKVCQGIQILGLILIFSSVFMAVDFKFESLYFKLLFTLYSLWLLSVIIRGISLLSDYDYLKRFLFDTWYGGMLYFVPIVALLPQNISTYKKVFTVILFLGSTFILLDIIFIRFLLYSPMADSDLGVIETFSDLSFACGFILLTFKFHSKKNQAIAVAVVALALIFAIIRARRGLILMYSSMILISYIFYLTRSRYRMAIMYFTILIAIIGALYMSGVYRPHKNPFFGFLLERGSEDTRTGVEICMYNDFDTVDWIIGRGINGDYFCPNIEEDQVTNYRTNIETGYLQTILKSGIISLGLYLLIAVPAIFIGLFDSKNMLSKAAAVWIFLSITKLYPTIENTFTLHYLLVWVSIGICYSKKIRYIPQRVMEREFSKN